MAAPGFSFLLGSCCLVRQEAVELEPALDIAAPWLRAGEDGAAVADAQEAREWKIVQEALDSAEFRQLQILRSRVRDCDEHPACRGPGGVLARQAQTLLRFLRARDGDLKKAEAMFREMLDWRHSFSVDEKVREWRRELAEQRTQRSIQMKRFETDVEMCQDRHGIPVRLIRTCAADLQGLAREFGKDIVLLDTVAKMERTHEEIRRAMFEREELISGQLQIIDMGDYGCHGVPELGARLWANLRLGREVSHITDTNYPETVRRAFIIRLGACTNTAWQYCIQPLLPQRTKAKLIPCGPNASSWVDRLKDELPPDEWEDLPCFLKCDTDTAFAAASPRGGLVPAGLAGPEQGCWKAKSQLPSAHKGQRDSQPAKLPAAAGKPLLGYTLNLAGKPPATVCARVQWFMLAALAFAAGALAVEPTALLATQ